MVFFHSKSLSCSFAINASYIHCMVSIQTTANLLISVVGPLRGFLFFYWYLLSSFQKHLSLRGLQNCNTQIGFQSQHIIKENCMEIDGKLSANIRKYEKEYAILVFSTNTVHIRYLMFVSSFSLIFSDSISPTWSCVTLLISLQQALISNLV